MKDFGVALGLVLVGGMLIIACGGGEQGGDAATQSAPAPQAPTASRQPPAGNVEVTLTTMPNPPRMGETPSKRW